MRVVDSQGKQHVWPPPGCEVGLNDMRPRSELHLRCRSLLHRMYPTQPILEEVPIPNENLVCDFYLPLRRVVVECHGKQHYKFVQHFHKDRVGYARAVNNDKRKKEWCKMNNISVAVLPYNESDEEWQVRIENAED